MNASMAGETSRSRRNLVEAFESFDGHALAIDIQNRMFEPRPAGALIGV
jgi:hypothetical protein